MNVEQAPIVDVRVPTKDKFNGLRNEVHQVARLAIEKTAKYLPLHQLEISIKDRPGEVIPGYAHAGWTHSANEIEIKVNPYAPDKDHLLTIELPRSISHELHHAVRAKALPDEPRTLGTALIREGLATIFENDVWPGEPSAWASIDSQLINELLQKTAQECNRAEYDHARWFFGSGDLPRWAGYGLGVYIVKNYLQNHHDLTAAKLVATPANVLLSEILKK